MSFGVRFSILIMQFQATISNNTLRKSIGDKAIFWYSVSYLFSKYWLYFDKGKWNVYYNIK